MLSQEQLEAMNARMSANTDTLIANKEQWLANRASEKEAQRLAQMNGERDEQ
jgi:triphosphoribosyl-dephospho-CoA synthetase